MNKTDLINAVAAATGSKKVEIEGILKSTFESISNELANNGNVTLIGFGTFSVIDKKARVGKNPQTGSKINIPAKKVAKFKPGKELAAKVNPAPVVVEPVPEPVVEPVKKTRKAPAKKK